ncbi:MAG: sigma-70 family RNA polymerase sigma factor [Chloroflexota bacterium]
MHSIKRWFSKERAGSISDTDAFTRLYETTNLSVFRYVYGFSGGLQQEAEDLTAETYTRAWKTHQHFNGNDQAALGWLLHIAKNLVIDSARRRKVHDVDEEINIELLIDPLQLPEVDIIAREQITTMWRVLGLLSKETREMLVLRYMLGWQVKQVAEYMGISENNVSVTIRRTLKSLQRDWPQLQEKDDE